MTDNAKGIYRRYEVKRTDGSSAKGGKHERCAYFVLDLEHDEFAIPALKAYAAACQKTHPNLANDLLCIVQTEPTRCGCREASCPHSLMNAFVPQTPSEQADRLMRPNDRGAKR